MLKKIRFILIIGVLILFFISVPIGLYINGILEDDKWYEIIVDFMVPWVNVFVTAVLSIFIWKVDEKSVEIEKRMEEQERERDILVFRETANKVYFSLVNIFEYLCNHLKDQESKKDVYISDDWASDLAKMRIVLSDVEIKKVFDLFRNVLVLKEKYTYEILISVCKFVMIPCLLDLYENDIFSDKISYEDIMNRTIKNAFQKIERLCVLEHWQDKEKIECLKPEDKYEKKFMEQHLGISIIYTGDDISRIKILDSDGKLILDGSIKAEGYTGYKEKYKNNRLVEKGQYENGKLINGIKYHVYKDDDVQNYEQVEEEMPMPVCTERYYKALEVKNGQIIYNENQSNYEYESIY